MHKYQKHALCWGERGGLSLSGSELFHPKDLEGLAVETKRARGNNAAAH